MGRLALQKPESRALMTTLKTQPNMLGIRMAFNAGKTRQWLEDGTADWFWEAAERYDVPVMAFAPAAVPRPPFCATGTYASNSPRELPNMPGIKLSAKIRRALPVSNRPVPK